VGHRDLAALPGAELVLSGLADLEQRRETIEALLVLIGAPRLRALGIPVPPSENEVSPEHRLYQLLGAQDPRTAYGRYNALVRRLVSFEHALACAHA
jgi:hypothetical protein